jgi:hypothetical protein
MTDLITINEAAARLGSGTKPFDVIRLIEAGDLAHVVLVDADSLNDQEPQ